MNGTGINRYLEENGRYSHMNLIVAVDEKWGIGKDGGLLCASPRGYEVFQRDHQWQDRGHGRRTWRAFPVESP